MRNRYDIPAGVDHDYWRLALEAEAELQPEFRKLETLATYNQAKVLQAFQAEKVSDFHFHGSTGYGYNDLGRETLERVFARAMEAEAALVRPQILSGTHALSLCLFGLLRPGDELVAVGQPYDTLLTVTGVNAPVPGSLREWGIGYRQLPMDPAQPLTADDLLGFLRPETKLITWQRSRGYSWHGGWHLGDLARLIKAVKDCRPDIVCMVDNCYGEFVDTIEPIAVGADIIAGSLIKNPGGGLAPGGGYVAGRAHLVEKIAHRYSAPGLGAEVGAAPQGYRLFFQGLFLAPHFVSQALKGVVFAAAVGERLGFAVLPAATDRRTDIVQAVSLPGPEAVVAFCQGIQKASPVDSHHLPQPGPMPGYDVPVIMAAGTFIQGGSLELSADAPLRPPYTVYLQGGLVYPHTQLAVLQAFQDVRRTSRPQ